MKADVLILAAYLYVQGVSKKYPADQQDQSHRLWCRSNQFFSGSLTATLSGSQMNFSSKSLVQSGVIYLYMC